MSDGFNRTDLSVTWRNDVDTNALGSDLLCKRFGEPNESCFGGCVDRLTRVAVAAYNAA